MKTLAVALLALVSVSSFAGTVKCDIYGQDKSKNFDKIDSIVVGQISPGQFVQERGREIVGLEDTFVNAAYSSSAGRLSLSILKGSPSIYGATAVLAEASGKSDGLSLTSRRDGLSILCQDVK